MLWRGGRILILAGRCTGRRRPWTVEVLRPGGASRKCRNGNKSSASRRQSGSRPPSRPLCRAASLSFACDASCLPTFPEKPACQLIAAMPASRGGANDRAFCFCDYKDTFRGCAKYQNIILHCRINGLANQSLLSLSLTDVFRTQERSFHGRPSDFAYKLVRSSTTAKPCSALQY